MRLAIDMSEAFEIAPADGYAGDIAPRTADAVISTAFSNASHSRSSATIASRRSRSSFMLVFLAPTG